MTINGAGAPMFRRLIRSAASALVARLRLKQYGLVLMALGLVIGGVGYWLPGHGGAQSLPESCFASPGACGYPDPNYNNDLGSTSVGVADCNALPSFDPLNLPYGTYYSGSGSTLEITGNNVTINRMNMGDFNIYVSGGTNNFTFENSCMETGDGTQNSVGIIVASGATNTTIKDSTISGAGTNIASSSIQGGSCVPGAGVSGGALGIAVDNNGANTIMDGLYVYDAGGGAPGTGGGTDATLENSYELINTVPACEHDEAVYFADLTITLHHNVLLNEESQTAAVFGDTFGTGACNNHLTMTDNFVAGGDYVVYPCGNASSVGTSTTDIENNRFARCLTTPLVDGNDECSGSNANGGDSHGYYPNGGFYNVAAYYYSGAGQTWANNYWDDNLDQVNIDGSSGTPVADPGPALALTGPSPGSSVSSMVTITATASTTAPATMHDVQFQVDGTNIPNCDPTTPTTGSTYKCTWDTTGLSNASHTVKVIATDSNNETAMSQEATTIQNAAPTTYTIWHPSDAPVNSDTTGDTGDLNLGTKFQSNESGYVVGVRFYKGIGNTGTHIGSLWTNDGTQLALVTFSNETASGWQQAYFSTPVAISANTTYVISYLAPNGNYAADHSYFNTSLTNGPLTALQNDDIAGDGDNGVYAYSGGAIFPNQSFMASNYWVDAMFSTVQSMPPTTTFVAPAGGAVVSGTETISVNVSGNFGVAISNVQFQVDGTNIPNCDPTTPTTGSTYKCTWDTTGLLNGTHVIQAVATDANDQIDANGEPVTLNNPTPAVTIVANPATISSGASSELVWSSTNATSCTASGAWSGSQTLNNNSGYAVSPSTTSTYTLTCNGPGGQSTPASTTVTVVPATTPPSTSSAAGTSVGASTGNRKSQTSATTASASSVPSAGQSTATGQLAAPDETASNSSAEPGQSLPKTSPKSSQWHLAAIVLGVGACLIVIIVAALWRWLIPSRRQLN